MLQKETLRKLITEYVEEYMVFRDFSKNTLQNKREMFVRLCRFLGEKPLNLETAQEYVNEMRKRSLTANSIKTEVANIKAFVHWLIKKKKIIEDDWTNDIEMPKVYHSPEMLPDIFQAEKIIELGTEPGVYDHVLHRKRKALMRFAMKFALRTGVRGVELTHIRGKDLDINEHDLAASKVYLIAAKGGNPEWQPLPLDMLDELKQHVNDALVFPVAISTCSEALKRGAKILGLSSNINMHVHILRKVFGTSLARLMPMSMVSRLMRHSDISITQKFYISYGIEEMAYKLNALHPLIRLATSPKDAISTFIQNTLEPYFTHDNRIQVSTEHNAGKKEFVIRVSY